MDGRELAREIASEEGEAIATATEQELSGPPSSGERARGLGLSEAMAIGSFIASCAQLAVQTWRARQDRALLLLALVEAADGNSTLVSRLDPEKRLNLIGKIVDRLMPESVGASPSIPIQKRHTKREWVSDWLGFETRALTSTVLMPFAEMDYYIVYRPITWIRPDATSPELPERITIPTGFVTELATVPAGFWWAFPPTGKYGHAAILHDWLYWDQSTSREMADRLFEVVMAELQVTLAVRKVFWAAVRVYGGGYWIDASEERARGGNRVLKKFPSTAATTWAEWRKQPDVFA